MKKSRMCKNNHNIVFDKAIETTTNNGYERFIHISMVYHCTKCIYIKVKKI